jgi:predicted ATPase
MMIDKIEIKNYKCIANEVITGYPLTVITGLNSTGKSSVLQAVLLLNKTMTKNGAIYLSKLPSAFTTIRNRYENAKEISICLTMDTKETVWHMSDTGEISTDGQKMDLEIEKSLFYLSANRTGTEAISSVSSQAKAGIQGEFLLGTFEKEKSTPVIPALIKESASSTLAVQLNYWLSYILGIKLELSTELRTELDVQTSYKSDGIASLDPSQLGAGVGYLTKILILCLRARENYVLMIENPEIHLHPAAQARLGEFFAFIARAGIQLFIETHCDHLINKIRYEVYKKRLEASAVGFFYKESIRSPFLKISILPNGKFDKDFPAGFFDATLGELIEIE